MPKISVIVPVYNVEKYLSQCLNSIIEQTFSDFRLINSEEYKFWASNEIYHDEEDKLQEATDRPKKGNAFLDWLNN